LSKEVQTSLQQFDWLVGFYEKQKIIWFKYVLFEIKKKNYHDGEYILKRKVLILIWICAV
jgi:hypothetical protein